MSHLADVKSLLDSRGLYEGKTIHGVNPLLLVEKIIRDRIIDSLYWKESCFGLNAATLLDRAVELTHVGGVYGATKPTPFLCLLFKLLQLQPSDEIVLEYLRPGGDEFKYLRVLAAMYVRMAWPAARVFRTLEPLLGDYRKLRYRAQNAWRITFVDELVDDLLTKERVCGLALPVMRTRAMLEDADELEPRETLLGSEAESEGEGEGEGEEKVGEETGAEAEAGVGGASP